MKEVLIVVVAIAALIGVFLTIKLQILSQKEEFNSHYFGDLNGSYGYEEESNSKKSQDN